ncbi:hypothetical protein DL765_009211 [Monosporascus sp. GIB2]|nr:hypothetical protein DL765_009211 [Monosporascus sp. GIB2]
MFYGVKGVYIDGFAVADLRWRRRLSRFKQWAPPGEPEGVPPDELRSSFGSEPSSFGNILKPLLTKFDPTRPPILDSDDETRKVLFTAGFVRSIAENSGFTGTCMLRSESDTVLALFLREPPCSVATPGFPLPQSSSKVAFLLVMGNFAETGILSFICSDACASVPVKDQAAVYGNSIIAALPLVPYSENKQADETRLMVAFQDKFAVDDNAPVFIAVLYVQILKPRAALLENDKLFLRALKWATSI